MQRLQEGDSVLFEMNLASGDEGGRLPFDRLQDCKFTTHIFRAREYQEVVDKAASETEGGESDPDDLTDDDPIPFYALP